MGYGKIFSSMYQGSMMGGGAMLFAVWPYVISNMQPNRDRTEFTVELNSALMAVLIGEPQSEIDAVIQRCCEPDARSRTPDNDGRKLVKLGQFLYHVVNGAHYDKIKRECDRRENARDRKAKQREREKLGIIAKGSQPPASGITAEQIYEVYPRRIGRGAALKKIESALKTTDGETLLKATTGFAAAWKGETDLQYCPHPSTWFAQQRYLDSPSSWVRNGNPAKSHEDPDVFKACGREWRFDGDGPVREDFGSGEDQDSAFESCRQYFDEKKARREAGE